jgi:hypothetical protein
MIQSRTHIRTLYLHTCFDFFLSDKEIKNVLLLSKEMRKEEMFTF